MDVRNTCFPFFCPGHAEICGTSMGHARHPMAIFVTVAGVTPHLQNLHYVPTRYESASLRMRGGKGEGTAKATVVCRAEQLGEIDY